MLLQSPMAMAPVAAPPRKGDTRAVLATGSAQEHESEDCGNGMPEQPCRAEEADKSPGYSREQAALFVMKQDRVIGSRMHGRLRSDLRRVLDADDLLLTVARRIDRLAAAGRLRATTEGQLRALVLRIAENAASEYARRLRAENTAAHSAARNPSSTSRAINHETNGMGERLESELGMTAAEHVMVRMRSNGAAHAEIAHALGLNGAMIRMRWLRMRERASGLSVGIHNGVAGTSD